MGEGYRADMVRVSMRGSSLLLSAKNRAVLHTLRQLQHISTLAALNDKYSIHVQ